MADVKVISDDACACESGNGLYPGLQPENNNAIIVRSKPGISVGNIIKEYVESGRKVYELDDFVLTFPVIAFSNNAGIREVGETVPEVLFSGDISSGTHAIESRVISPDPGGLDLTAPFTFTKADVYRASAGAAEVHTITVLDVEGNQSVKSSSVPFKNAIYQGFNSLATLNETEIKALANKHLVDTVIQQYGNQKTYVVPLEPGGPKYIYWCGPIGTPVPVGATLNGLTLPLYYGHPNISVTNIHDGGISVPYWVVRTANRFNIDTYQITLS